MEPAVDFAGDARHLSHAFRDEQSRRPAAPFPATRPRNVCNPAPADFALLLRQRKRQLAAPSSAFVRERFVGVESSDGDGEARWVVAIGRPQEA